MFTVIEAQGFNLTIDIRWLSANRVLGHAGQVDKDEIDDGAGVQLKHDWLTADLLVVATDALSVDFYLFTCLRQVKVALTRLVQKLNEVLIRLR